MPRSKYSQNIGPHLRTIADRLGGVPELVSGLEVIRERPSHAKEVYLLYRRLIGRMVMLDAVDIACIDTSQRKMDAMLAEQGSVSKVGANDIVRALGSRVNVLNSIVIRSVRPDSEYYEPALFLLQTRMHGGHLMKLMGSQPSDGEPWSERVIWGHMAVTGPEALLHFAICHYLDCYFAEELNGQGIEAAQHKEFFINALGDVIILDHMNNRSEESIYKIWSGSSNEGGLEWITQSRLDSFN